MRIVVAVVALVTCVHAGLWGLLHRQYSSPDFNSQLASVSYSPYTRSQHPDNGDRPTAEQIRADLRLLSSYTRTIRTYSSTGGVELVPGIAAELGLRVTIGVWIDKNEARNEREIQSALAATATLMRSWSATRPRYAPKSPSTSSSLSSSASNA
jgi:exo-beta-1,3-glucanase (GH17 family)